MIILKGIWCTTEKEESREYIRDIWYATCVSVPHFEFFNYLTDIILINTISIFHYVKLIILFALPKWLCLYIVHFNGVYCVVCSKSMNTITSKIWVPQCPHKITFLAVALALIARTNWNSLAKDFWFEYLWYLKTDFNVFWRWFWIAPHDVG